MQWKAAAVVEAAFIYRTKYTSVFKKAPLTDCYPAMIPPVTLAPVPSSVNVEFIALILLKLRTKAPHPGLLLFSVMFNSHFFFARMHTLTHHSIAGVEESLFARWALTHTKLEWEACREKLAQCFSEKNQTTSAKARTHTISVLSYLSKVSVNVEIAFVTNKEDGTSQRHICLFR